MALSGSVNGGGGLGGSYLRLEWDASQNWGGNYSTVNVRLYLVLQGGTSTSATESGNINIEGNVSGFSRGTTNRGTNSTSLVHSYSINIGHNGDGTRSFSSSGFFDSGWSSFPNLNVGGSWQLDTIPRQANFTSYGADNVTDEAFRIYCSMDATCNFFQYSLEDGVGWRDQSSATASSYSVTVNNRPSGVTQNFRVRVRRADSGLWTESPVLQTTTKSQNNFMDFFEEI